MTIHNAKVAFNQDGTPVADQFDDVYFSNADGLEETRYVFLRNNHLPERWLAWQETAFTIAETGFGTGLNFLVTWLAFRQFRQANPQSPLTHLYFISTEKFPVEQADLQRALQKWPELAQISQQLIDQYPPAVGGCHRMSFEQGCINLDLYLGDVHQLFPQWHCLPAGSIDCWYLDGFAPSKNPDMWSAELFQQMARLSREQSTFATFTAAGLVKRGLKEVGFEVEKRKGFGRKRDMLAGRLAAPPEHRIEDKIHFRQAAQGIDKSVKVAVVGSGLAGANMTFSLARKGLNVTMFEQSVQPASGASGNPQGGFYPQLNAQFNNASRVQSVSFWYARNLYRQLLSDGFEFAHQWCGVLQLAFNDKVSARQQNMRSKALWPTPLIEWVDSSQSSAIANMPLPYPAIHIPQGGWISPPQLVRALLQAAQTLYGCELISDRKLLKLQKNDKWQLSWADGTVSEFDVVVLATGAESPSISQLSELPFRLVRGQVESLPSQTPLSELTTVLCHKGYLTPQFEGQHALGSTYVKNDLSLNYRESEQVLNRDMNIKALDKCEWPKTLVFADKGRAAIRCSSPDHLPIVGAVPDYGKQSVQYQHLYKALPLRQYDYPQDEDNLFVLAGLGSRGLTTAPLMAELLASQIVGHPLPLENDLLKALNPNRFLIRELIRRADGGDIAGR